MEAYLIATIVLFGLALMLNLLAIGQAMENKSKSKNLLPAAISLVIYLGFLTWGIILLVS
jgi:hypothetical protein